jgi:hypothetical protein
LAKAVVGNVTVEVGETALRASSVRKTRAKPGAGTGIVHVLAVWSQFTVVTLSVPLRRPSAFCTSPSVYLREKCACASTVSITQPSKKRKEKNRGGRGRSLGKKPEGRSKVMKTYLPCPSEGAFG